MFGFLEDDGRRTAGRTTGDGVNHRALNFRTYSLAPHTGRISNFCGLIPACSNQQQSFAH
jgi:hypothetical protein